MAEELVKQKVELLAQQKAKSDRIHELLNASGGLNDTSRKTCKNLEAAITASKRPGYFAYYEAPDNVKQQVRSGEIDRLYGQMMRLQKQIDQLTDKIDSRAQQIPSEPYSQTSKLHSATKRPSDSPNPHIHNVKQWFAAYGTPKQGSGGMYSSFTPEKKMYGGTAHYSAFRSLSSTMKKGRLTK